MKTEAQIKYEILNLYAKVSMQGKTLKEYGPRKLLDEIYDYTKTLAE